MNTNLATALTAPLKLAMLTLMTVVMLQAPAQAQDAPLKRGDVETIVREYILENPDIIREAFEELERREVAAANEARAQAVSTVSDVLFNSTRQVELGNPDGDVTLVEFFDYNCGYCKRAMIDMMRLLEEDDKLRIVLKEFPVLGEGSVEAARVAVAVNAVAPEKYLEFHRELMSARGQANRASAIEAAKNTGLEIEALDAAMNDPEVNATIEEVYTLARRLGLNGTPAYVIGDEVMMGAVGYDRLKQGIEATRNCGEAAC
ncbi:DsbA family protein [Stappia stellulata]|uniref:DsbA family protein n=1 Tax=Stappia stellulata TaxID=71235 RepID=UPI0003FD8BA4|nr:DsbA family protein [Stappia stellulata]